MACTLLGELWEADGEITTQPSERAMRQFKVQSDAATDTTTAAINAVGIVRGDPFKNSAGTTINERLTAQRISARRDPDGNGSYKIYLVTVEYSTISGSLNPLPGGDIDNPLDRPIQEEWSFETVQEVAYKARIYNLITEEFNEDETLVCNSAGDIFQDQPTKNIYLPTLTFRRNESTFDYDLASTYVGKVNSAAWLGAAQYAALCTGISASRGFETGWPAYWVVSYTFQFKETLWYTEIVDSGFYYLDKSADPPKPKPFLDKDGMPVTSPKLLDGYGGAITLDPDEDPAELAQFRKYMMFGEVDFAGLGLTP